MLDADDFDQFDCFESNFHKNRKECQECSAYDSCIEEEKIYRREICRNCKEKCLVSVNFIMNLTKCPIGERDEKYLGD